MIIQWQIIMAKTEVDGVKLLISSYNLHDALLSWTHPLMVSNLKFTSISVKVHTWMCPNKHDTIMQCKLFLSHTDGVSCKVKRWWLGEYSITVLLQTLQLVQNEPVFLCTACGSDLLAQKKKELDCKCVSMPLLLNNNYKIVASLT